MRPPCPSWQDPNAAANTENLKMFDTQTRAPLTPAEEYNYAKLAMEWYGWGSPIGLGILVVCLAATAVLLRVAVFGF